MIGREKLKLSNTTQISKFEGIFSILFIKKTTSVSGGGWLRTLEFYVKCISP